VTVKISDKDLQHQTRRGLPLTPMHQVLIALTFYATRPFQRVIGDSKKQLLKVNENYCTSDDPPVS